MTNITAISKQDLNVAGIDEIEMPEDMQQELATLSDDMGFLKNAHFYGSNPLEKPKSVLDNLLEKLGSMAYSVKNREPLTRFNTAAEFARQSEFTPIGLPHQISLIVEVNPCFTWIKNDRPIVQIIFADSYFTVRVNESVRADVFTDVAFNPLSKELATLLRSITL